MSSGAPDSTGKTAPEIYRILRSNDPQDPLWSWPDCLLPICEWGCAIMSCVDCAVPDFPVRIFDPNIHCDNKSWDWSAMANSFPSAPLCDPMDSSSRLLAMTAVIVRVRLT